MVKKLFFGFLCMNSFLIWRWYRKKLLKNPKVKCYQFGLCEFFHNEPDFAFIENGLEELKRKDVRLYRILEDSDFCSFIVEGDFYFWSSAGISKFKIKNVSKAWKIDGFLFIASWAALQCELLSNMGFLERSYAPVKYRRTITENWIRWMKDNGVNEELYSHIEK